MSGLPRWLAPLVWVSGLGALAVLAWGIGTGLEVPGAERREDANLLVTRGNAPVRRWIVAHVDTKAQGHSMAGRLVAVWVVVVAVATLTTLTVIRCGTDAVLPLWAVTLGAGLSLVSGVLASQGRLRGETPGARDNGSGLVAALTVAELGLPPETGLLLTGAEEFGLCGARAFVAAEGDPAALEIINVDTAADRGPVYLVAHDDRGIGLAARLVEPLTGELGGLELRFRRLPMGILTDSLPFARRGARAITIGRLDWSVLRLIHTRRDTLEGLDLATARSVGRALAALPPIG